MFRDSRGVVHTVCSADPLSDLPAGAASALQSALLGPVAGDLGGALERCDAVVELLEAWQDAFFRSLPEAVDLGEERLWARRAGMSLDEIEAQYAEEQDDEEGHDDEDDGIDPGLVDLAGGIDADDDPRQLLPEDLVSILERELLLLPIRTRLEALVAAADLVDGWSDLLGDEEKLLGHLLLRHGDGDGDGPSLPFSHDEPFEHERLADRHAELHRRHGPGHCS